MVWEARFDPYVFCSHLSGLYFCSMHPTNFRSGILTLAFGALLFVFRHGKRLALVVREASSWCGRRGTAMGRQHRAGAHGTTLNLALRVFACSRGRTRGFSRGVRGEGHEGHRPRVCWRVRVRCPKARRGPKAGGQDTIRQNSTHDDWTLEVGAVLRPPLFIS